MNKIFNKKIIFWVEAVLIVLFVAFSTVLILKTIFSKQKVINQSAGQVLDSAEIVKSFSDKPVKSLSGDSYGRQMNLIATLKYKLDDKDYELLVESKDSMLFSVDKSVLGDTKVVKSEITDFMKINGFSKAYYKPYGSDGSLEYSTYTNSSTVCQFSNSKLNSQVKFLSFEMVCLDKKVIQDKYIQVDKLLATDKKTKQLNGFSQALIQTESKGNLAYATISLNSNKSHQKLLFAASRNSWEYLGDLLAGGKQYSNGKYSITPELRQSIKNSKYGDFLSTVLAIG